MSKFADIHSDVEAFMRQHWQESHLWTGVLRASHDLFLHTEALSALQDRASFG
jgi:hypothetical protein